MCAQYIRKDHLYKRAKQEGYRGRAAYKLIELDSKYKLLRPGLKVLDLGCYPGGWLQVCRERLGANGIVVGIDLVPVEPFLELPTNSQMSFAKTRILEGDVTAEPVQIEIRNACGGEVDVVLSDMSPKLSGIRFRDVARSAELVETAYRVAGKVLRQDGALVVKVFPGSEVDTQFMELKKSFGRVTRSRLKSTRAGSDEIYFVAEHFTKKA